MHTRTIELTIRRLLRTRGADKTICPSEVARALEPEGWRALMPEIRAAAKRMVASGELVVKQRGRIVDIERVKGPIRLARKSSYVDAYRGIDFRKQPDRYRVGRGEEGVLVAEPYKSELLPLWRFKTKEIAVASSKALWKAFVAYRKKREFVGMDMARKYLQMGFTRARRYANHKSGKKWERGEVKPIEADDEKAAAASVFYEMWQRAERDRTYRTWRKAMRES